MNAKNISETKKQYSFLSKEDYLGIVSMDPSNFVIDSTSKNIIIRIKRTNDEDWLHSNTYNAFDLVSSVNFHFGFPVQEKSKNVEYSIEFELTGSSNKKHPIFDTEIKNVVLRHYYPKTFFILHPHQAINYIGGKVLQSLKEKSAGSVIEVILFPLSIYVTALTIIYSKKTWRRSVNKYYALYKCNFSKKDIFILIPIAADVVMQNNIYHFPLVGLVLVTAYNIKGKSMFVFFLLLAFNLFLVSILFTLVNVRFIADRASLWVFVLVVLATSKLLKDQMR